MLWKIVRGDIIWLALLKIPEVEKVKFSISYVELFGKRLHAPNKRLLRNMISSLAEAMMYYRFKSAHRILLDIRRISWGNSSLVHRVWSSEKSCRSRAYTTLRQVYKDKPEKLSCRCN
jgi:hypothetical protein